MFWSVVYALISGVNVFVATSPGGSEALTWGIAAAFGLLSIIFAIEAVGERLESRLEDLNDSEDEDDF